MITRIRGFSGCGFETIAGLKVELGEAVIEADPKISSGGERI
jgi:hypothetical protein